jgi:hypothetical protein
VEEKKMDRIKLYFSLGFFGLAAVHGSWVFAVCSVALFGLDTLSAYLSVNSDEIEKKVTAQVAALAARVDAQQAELNGVKFGLNDVRTYMGAPNV